jgi:CRISPR/Cas system-associated exonuclease Cas4 (RecB family)
MVRKLKGPVKKVWESKIKQSPSKNRHISYSSISTYNKCPRLWDLQYRQKVIPFTQSIYTIFGSAMHETIQEWLEVMYMESAKAAMNMNLDDLLYKKMISQYKIGKAVNGHKHFSTPDELTQFWIDGKHILEYLKKKRGSYFSTRTMKLAGIETLLYQELKPGVMFKGLVDLVFYHPVNDTWTVMDIKTSTSGWRDNQKKNPNLTAQVVLYKEFFAKQFGIDRDKINVEYFIVKRRVPAEAEFAVMQRRVQEFSPNAGPRKTKQVLESMNRFLTDVLDKEGNFIDKEYKCNSPLGKCQECSSISIS